MRIGEKLTVDQIVGDRAQVQGLLGLVEAMSLQMERLESLEANQAETDIHVVSHLLKQKNALNLQIATLEKQRDQVQRELVPLREEWAQLVEKVATAKASDLDATVITRYTLKTAWLEIIKERGLLRMDDNDD